MSFLGRVIRLRTCNPPIRHIQRVINSTRRLGLGLATTHRSLTTSSPSRPTTSGLHASTIPLFLRSMPGQRRKSKSTNSEPQPERASAARNDDNAPRGPDHASSWRLDLTIERDWEREAAENSPDFQAFMRAAELIAPFFFFQTHFPEEEGFEYVVVPFIREVCYTQKTEGGEEVAVTIPRDDTCVFQAARSGDPRTRVNGIKQGGAVCLALSMLPPTLASSELENADISDAAFGAAEQALLETIGMLQNPDFEGSNPVPDEWVEGCLAMVCVGGKTRVYEYSKAKGLCDPHANIGWMLLKSDEELRRKRGLPPRPLLRDAESLSKSTNSQSKAQSEPERTDSPKRKVWSDPFPGVATQDEYALSYYAHEIAKITNDVCSLYSLRKRALEIPLAYFQFCFPKEDRFDHNDAGPLERDLVYTELTDRGEEVVVTIPWENTRMYMVTDMNRVRIVGFALYVLPPAPVASSEPKNAETPWGRGISDAAMIAVSQELEEVIRKRFQGPGWDGIPGLFMDSCITLVFFVGLEMQVGSYSMREGVRWSARGPAVEDGCGIAAASDPSNYRLAPRSRV